MNILSANWSIHNMHISCILLMYGLQESAPPPTFLLVSPPLFVNMIGLSQWRAAIGLWNHCRIRLVNHSPLSNPFRQPFDIEGGNCSLNRVPPDPSITRFIALPFQKKIALKSKKMIHFSKDHLLLSLHGDTICRLVTLMFYFMFLLLLSGDVELNPGPITVEQGNSSGSNNNYYYCTVRTQINESLKKHFADIERTTKDCISDIRAKLFSERLISEAVNDSPTFDEIFNDFMTGLKKLSEISMLVKHYKIFLHCLKCSGGLSSQDVIDSLISEWKTNESQSKP